MVECPLESIETGSRNPPGHHPGSLFTIESIEPAGLSLLIRLKISFRHEWHRGNTEKLPPIFMQ